MATLPRPPYVTTFTFRHLTLREAEEALVAGALDHEHCLLSALDTLGPTPFRSEAGAELQAIYTWLIQAHRRGTYDEYENRDNFAALLSDPGDRWYVQEDLFDGNTTTPDYCQSLADALRSAYEAQDAALRAVRALSDAPVQLGPLGEEMPRHQPRPRGGVA